MNHRPKLKIPLKEIDYILEFIVLLILVAVWILTIISYHSLPEMVPLHFNIKGEADDFGSKTTILILPALLTVLYITMTIINRFPHNFNYPVIITDLNAYSQYTIATKMIRYLKALVVIIMGFITLKTIQYDNQEDQGPGIWFLPITLSLIVIPLIYFTVKSFKTKP